MLVMARDHNKAGDTHDDANDKPQDCGTKMKPELPDTDIDFQILNLAEGRQT